MKPRYLFPKDFMADPSANVFNGRMYVYPSHDYDSGAAFDDDGGHFQMRDYHVLSMDDVMNGEITDHGVILDVDDVPWAEKQMWDNDVVEKNGKYYLVFSAKDYKRVHSRVNLHLSSAPTVLIHASLKMMTVKFTVISVDYGAVSCSGTVTTN